MVRFAVINNVYNLYLLIRITDPWRLNESEVIKESDGSLTQSEEPLLGVGHSGKCIPKLSLPLIPATESMQFSDRNDGR